VRVLIDPFEFLRLRAEFGFIFWLGTMQLEFALTVVLTLVFSWV
jgi:hypothetical protein